MKNLSGSANWFALEKDTIKEELEIEVDNRTVLSYPINGVFYFLSSDGKPLVFSNDGGAEEYIVKNELKGYEVDKFQDFNFTDIELIEL